MGDAFYAVSFDPAPYSGIVKGQETEVAIILRSAPLTPFPTVFADEGEEQENDRLLRSRLTECYAPRNGIRAMAVAPLAPIIVSFVGNAVYNFAIERLQDEAKRLAERSTKAYAATVIATRQAAPADLSGISCILFVRRTKQEAQPGTAVTAATTPGLVLLLRRNDRGGSASTWLISYLWLGNAVAVTKRGTEKEPASVQVNVALTISAPIPDRRPPVPIKPITSIAFKAVKAPIGYQADLCPTKAGGGTCQFESDLVSSIPNDLSALQVTVGINEVGSAADAKTRAEAGIKALNETVKPSYTKLIDMLAAAVKPD